MSEWIEYLGALKTTLDIFKTVRTDVLSGSQGEQARVQIQKAEDALRRAEAEVAKGLGYKLCRCTFSPSDNALEQRPADKYLSDLWRQKSSPA